MEIERGPVFKPSWVERARELAEASKTRHKMLSEEEKLALIGSFEWDIPNNKVTWSDGLYEIYGLKPQEFGASFEAFVDRVHPDDRERVQATIQEVFSRGEPFATEERIVRSDGAVRLLATRGEVIKDEKGIPVRMIGICQDITERVQAEAELRQSEALKGAIFDSAPACIITIDHTGNIIEFNPAAEKTFGYTRDEVIGKELAETIVPPSLRERHRRGLAHYLATGESSILGKRIEITGVRSDGSQFPVELAITAIDLGGPPLFTAYLQDISLRKRAEELLGDYNRELEKEVQRRTHELEHELKVAQEFLKEARDRVDGPLLGDSVAVRGLREAVEVYAATDETLLLAGPPGAGQEAIARSIHHQSNRGSRPFIYVNCALLHTSAQEALFGTLPPESGSDAIPDVGKFDLANAGTLFLEGVNELTAKVQERLAETLEKLERQRAEGRRPSPDVRVIAYSSRDLAQETTDGRFIPSLHQLLSKRQLTVPALAERREDIPVLVEHFIHQHARRLGKTIEGVSPESMERLQSYRWQGNIRELSNLLERVIVGASGPQLEIEESLLEEGITLDRYRLVEKLGEGGMGEVWRAQHQLLARPAAVKLIRSEALVDVQGRESVLKRFQREAQVTANLQSPNTVKLYDFGVSETGSFYFVMELLSGIDLESMVKRFGELKAERVVMLLRQACRSLSEAHGAGLVHRDIKPANLFVCKLGRECDFIKVLDFGIVKPTVQTGQSMLTAAGAVTGTPAYMAPELFLDKGEVDGRSDIYALGCVAFYMLTGRLVFESTKPVEQLLQHAKTPPEPPSRFTELSIPKSLDQLVLACLEKQPDDRPNSADELWRMLGQIEFDDPWTLERAEEWWRIHMPEHFDST